MQTFISFGSILGTLLSPILYNNSSTYAFGLSTIFIIIALLYASIFLKETVINTEVNTFFYTVINKFNLNIIVYEIFKISPKTFNTLFFPISYNFK